MVSIVVERVGSVIVKIKSGIVHEAIRRARLCARGGGRTPTAGRWERAATWAVFRHHRTQI